MPCAKTHNDSYVAHDGDDAKQDSFFSISHPSAVAPTFDHHSLKGRKHIYACCLLAVMSSVLAIAQSGLEAPSPVPLIALDSRPVLAELLLEVERRSPRVGDTQFPVDKPTPGCQGVPFSTNNKLTGVSDQWQAEWTTGSELAAKIEQDSSVVEDPILTAYVNSLELTIVQKSDLHGCFLVKILDTSEVNAFSLPGGFLYLTSGLILLADSEGELTAALAHETGHVTARHFAKVEHKMRIGRRVALAAGPAGYLVRRLLGPLLTKKMIRNTEFEADQLSLQYQNASGYDPNEFSRLLQSALQDQDKPPSFIGRLFETHPLISTRIKRLDKMRNQLPPGAIDQPTDTSKFNQARARLATLLNLASPDSDIP
ncbi:MAG TPA: M48 family metalloprotease [Terriglobales bacterium]|nr:M48 family metalloprotease [Terriglobales bacterium]